MLVKSPRARANEAELQLHADSDEPVRAAALEQSLALPEWLRTRTLANGARGFSALPCR
jgi:hypothetical protein